ncbi:hypothetical protein BOX15_Mlig024173g2, partial [Macrostomum lignano]
LPSASPAPPAAVAVAGLSASEPAEPDEPDFVSALPDRLKCPICLGHLKSPLQTCCGHRFCRGCFFSAAAAAAASTTTSGAASTVQPALQLHHQHLHLHHHQQHHQFQQPLPASAAAAAAAAAAASPASVGARRACPLCRSPILDVGPSAAGRGGLTAGVFNDLATEREVQQLTVRCPRTGCGAAMELGGLRSHLATACQFVEELCPEQCQSRIRRCDLAAHRAACRERQVACVFCSASVPYRQLNFHYLFGCSNFPMPCPHRCGRVLAGHQRLHEHVDRACPLTLVLCPFASFGCPAANRHRRDLGRHVAEAHSYHLQLLWQQQQHPHQQQQQQQQQRATTADLNCMLDKLVVNLQQPMQSQQQQMYAAQQQQQQAAALRNLLHQQQQQQQQQQQYQQYQPAWR